MKCLLRSRLLILVHLLVIVLVLLLVRPSPRECSISLLHGVVLGGFLLLLVAVVRPVASVVDGEVPRLLLLLAQAPGHVVGFVEADEAAHAGVPGGGRAADVVDGALRLLLGDGAGRVVAPAAHGPEHGVEALDGVLVAQAVPLRLGPDAPGGRLPDLGVEGELLGVLEGEDVDLVLVGRVPAPAFGVLELLARQDVVGHLGGRPADGVLSVEQGRLEVDELLGDGHVGPHDGRVQAGVAGGVEHVQPLAARVLEEEVEHVHHVLFPVLVGVAVIVTKAQPVASGAVVDELGLADHLRDPGLDGRAPVLVQVPAVEEQGAPQLGVEQVQEPLQLPGGRVAGQRGMQDILSLVVAGRLVCVAVDEDLGVLCAAEPACHHERSLASCVLLLDSARASLDEVLEELIGLGARAGCHSAVNDQFI